MVTLFYLLLLALVAAELIKGLSANGTPPFLQKYPWQMDLAYFMWRNIKLIRTVLIIVIIYLGLSITAKGGSSIMVGGTILALIWAGIYWLFNHYWVGRKKFDPLTKLVFAKAEDSRLDPKIRIMGVDVNGHQKAYPVSMMFYHHQIGDIVGNQPVWVTYCGLCRSGRVYDRLVDGRTLEFQLVGAITYNAVLKDFQTETWWRQETGEAAKGHYAGRTLDDVPFEEMSLENWLAKYPESDILQFDEKYTQAYNIRDKIMNYEASLPGWHMQDTPAMIIGVEVGDKARAYDWDEMKKRRMVMDELGGTPLLVLSAADESYAFVYDRSVEGEALEFEFKDEVLTDSKTGSQWDHLGRCTTGELSGKQLQHLQCYQQCVRAWSAFHGHTDFYDFNG